MSGATSCRTIPESLREYGRGIAGGLLFSLPLLYTMEVWWFGFIVHPLRLLLYVVATYILLLGYNRYAGLRDDASLLEAAIDSMEEMGIGILLSAFILALLGRITPEMHHSEIMGKIIMEAMTVAIGVSVGTAQLGAYDGDTGKKNQDKEQESCDTEVSSYWEQVVIAWCGAVLIAANVGPTEEIEMLAIESSAFQLLLMALVSISLAVLVLFFSDFHGSKRFATRAKLRDILQGAITTYAVALSAAAAMGWFFGRMDGASLEIAIAQTVVLALPATLGASAGRLLLQLNSQN